jgi:hypothetical protein
MGYAPNHKAFNAFVRDDESIVDTIATQVAAAAATATTVGSTLGNTYQASASGVTAELTTAIQSLAANQQTLYRHVEPSLTQQMAAMSYQQGPECLPPPYPKFGDPDGSSVHRLPRQR